MQYKAPMRITKIVDATMIRLRRRNIVRISERLISSEPPESATPPPLRIPPGPDLPGPTSVELLTEYPLVRQVFTLPQFNSIYGINGRINRSLQPHRAVVLYIA